MRILYIEDNPDDIELIRNELQKQAPHIVMDTASTQTEAFAKLDRYAEYDLLLTDLNLPDGNGLTILTHVRGKALPMAIVLITGKGDEEIAVAALKAGADDYVAKRGDFRKKLPRVLENALAHFKTRTHMESIPLRVLYAEDEEIDIYLLSSHLATHSPNIHLHTVKSGAALLKLLPDQMNDAAPLPWDILLLDYRLPDVQSLELIKEIRQTRGLAIPIVILTGQGDEEVAVCMLHLGVSDYVVKQRGYLAKMPWVIHNAYHSYHLTRKNEALLEAQAKYRSLVEKIPAIVYTAALDEIRTTLYISPIIESMIGYMPAEWLADPDRWVRLIHPDDHSRVLAELAISRQTSRPFQCEYRMIHRGGNILWFRDEAVVIENGKGNPLFLQGVMFDITSRKDAELALKASEERTRHVIESSPVGIAIHLDGKVFSANSAFVSMFGYEPDEIEGISISMLLDAGSSKEVLRFVHQLDQPLVFCLSGCKGRKKDNTPLDLSLWFSRMEYEGKSAALGFWMDVSQEKKLQNQLVRAQKLEAIGTIAGGIAHDFNNILAIIMGYAEMAAYNCPKDDPVQGNLDQIFHAGLRAKDLVKQIMNVCRKSDQEFILVKISSIVTEVCKMMRASLPSFIEIRQNIVISEDAFPGMVMADPGQIHQILINLFTNASHAMREKGGLIEVGLTDVNFDPHDASMHPDLKPCPYMKLSVSDTGCGIDPEIADRIFDPYFTTKKMGEGTGLGLAVVHGIIKSHNGVITVDSQKGKGSVFTIFLPRIQALKEDAKAESPVIRGKGERILFVDDEEAITKLWFKVLTSLGYDVVSKTSSKEALEIFRSRPDQFDLVITDQTMPQMTGMMFAGELLTIRPDIPIILCTGFSETASKERTREIGIREFLFKPLDTRSVSVAIRRALNCDQKIAPVIDQGE